MRVYISKQYPAQNTTSKASLHIELTVFIKKEIYTDLSFISIIIMSIIPVRLKQCIRNSKCASCRHKLSSNCSQQARVKRRRKQQAI